MHRARSVIAVACVLAAGCSSPGVVDEASRAATVEASTHRAGGWGMLVFGDHGYDLDYLETEDFEPPLTWEQFVAKERADWLDDKRPAAEFRPPAATQHRNGGWVSASGLRPVATAMHDYCRTRARCDFATMLGDNVYPRGATLGADGHDDATRFDRIFRAPFAPFVELAPEFRVYVTLGNHDWKSSRAGAMAEVEYLERTAPFYMDGIVYRVRPPAAGGEVELFVIDTTVLLAGHTVYEDSLDDDAHELPSTEVEVPDPWAVPANDVERGMAGWLEKALAESTARWKIVVGHHPLWSSAGSKYEQARVLRRLILPTLCRYADAYLAGHDHTLELHYDDCREALPGIQVPPLPSIVSGAASKQRALNSAFMRHQAERYPQLETAWARGLLWGFAHLTLDDDTATLRFITTPDDGSGTADVAYETRFPRRGFRR